VLGKPNAVSTTIEKTSTQLAECILLIRESSNYPKSMIYQCTTDYFITQLDK
jgi:hypothetical protein